MNQKIEAIGIVFMIISIGLYYSATSVKIRDSWVETTYDINGRIKQEWQPETWITIYPYAWIGIVMFLIGLAVVGIGAALPSPPIDESKKEPEKTTEKKEPQAGGFFR
jgi:hypothetical protein